MRRKQVMHRTTTINLTVEKQQAEKSLVIQSLPLPTERFRLELILELPI
jgi:hypothetical protein